MDSVIAIMATVRLPCSHRSWIIRVNDTGKKTSRKAKTRERTGGGRGGIQKPHRYRTAWYLGQSWSRGTHEAATLAKRSNRISITTAMLNTRNARLRESRQALSGLLCMPVALRQ